MEPKKKPLVLRWLHGLEEILLTLALLAMIVLSFSQIVLRNFFGISLIWADAFLRYLVLWVAMFGAMVATREYNHINVDVLSHLLPGRSNAALRVVTDLFSAGVCFLLSYAGVLFLREEYAGGEMAFGPVPNWVAELILPIGLGIIGLRFLYHAGRHLKEAIHGVPAIEQTEESSS
jgi:TRAP-type C4-dicarboxylate transport system permease small subunit